MPIRQPLGRAGTVAGRFATLLTPAYTSSHPRYYICPSSVKRSALSTLSARLSLEAACIIKSLGTRVYSRYVRTGQH